MKAKDMMEPSIMRGFINALAPSLMTVDLLITAFSPTTDPRRRACMHA